MITGHCTEGMHEDACPAPMACFCECHPPLPEPPDPRGRTRDAGGHNTDLQQWEAEKRQPEVIG